MEQVKKTIFKDNIYKTKANSRIIWDKLWGNTRTYFVLKYIQMVIRNRKLAIKGIYNRKAWVLSSFEVFKLIEKCGGNFSIEGLEHIKNLNEPVVFVSNHMSAMESMIFPCLIAPYRKVTFVVKEALTTHFLFGPVMRARKPITVGRSNSREDLMSVIKQGKELLTEGTSVIIFPQGSRKEIFKTSDFNSLGVKLAKSAKVKIVPIALKTDFWGNGKLVKDLGAIHRNKKIYISIDSPIEISGNGKEANDRAIKFISDKLDYWNKTTELIH